MVMSASSEEFNLYFMFFFKKLETIFIDFPQKSHSLIIINIKTMMHFYASSATFP